MQKHRHINTYDTGNFIIIYLTVIFYIQGKFKEDFIGHEDQVGHFKVIVGVVDVQFDLNHENYKDNIVRIKYTLAFVCSGKRCYCSIYCRYN